MPSSPSPFTRTQPIFEYRISRLDDGSGFMPQRGVSGNLDGISRRMYWCDAVPVPAPTLEMAETYLASIQQFDLRDSPGVIVFETA